jgi:serine-type D-Ala-D-Ala carboxypeptidase/endopeptidase
MKSGLFLLAATLSATMCNGAEAASPESPSPTSNWPSVETEVSSQYAPVIASYPWVGVSVGVIRGNEVRFYNYGDAGGGQSATENSVYTINSMTKAFVGTALAEEVIEGKVNLTDPVQKYLPNQVVPQAPERQIELVDLATHTSGLPRVPANLIQPDSLDPYRNYTDDLFFTALAGIQFKSDDQIGTTYLYSNFGFGLLGYALAQLDGTSFTQMMNQRVIQPFALTDTSADQNTPSATNPIATGHDTSGFVQGQRGGPETMAGSWAVYSTTADIAHFLLAYLSSDESTSLGKALDLAQTSTGRSAGAGMTSGLGWFIHESSGTRYKDGGGGGFTSIMFFNRARHTGLVVLSNTDDNNAISIEQRAWNIMTVLKN